MISDTQQRLAGLSLVVVAYWATVAAIVWAGVALSQGRLVYPLDDTYIHMAMAKNAALHGVWGMTAEGFTSTSSSPLWTGLLAFTYLVAGVSDTAPLVLNIAIGTAVLFSVHRLFADAGISPLGATLGSAAVMLLGTLPTLTVIGMEHTLHALLAVWFVVLGVRAVGNPELRPRDLALVATLAAILTLTRYEGTFAVAAIAVAFMFERRWRVALTVSAAGAIPILLYGAWCQWHGAFPVPNSVLLKGVVPSLTSAAEGRPGVLLLALSGLIDNPQLGFLVVAALGLALALGSSARGHSHRMLALVFTACALLHAQFALTEWSYGHETYLVVLGLVIVTVMLADLNRAALMTRAWPMPAIVIMVLLALVLAFPLVRRGLVLVKQTPIAMSNIFEQQYQAAQFLDQFYRGHRVAVNDIGAIAFVADVKLLDIWGLASHDVAALKWRGEFTSAAVERLAERDAVDIAIIYTSWLTDYGGVPASWQEVGRWTVANSVVLGDARISFFAVSRTARAALMANLTAYSDRLPTTVVQEGPYRALR